jgi:protein-disulfide isomerase
MRRFALSLAAAAALLPPGGAAAFDITAMTDAERAALHQEIRDYLLANPDLLVEMANLLESREQAQQAASDAELVKANAGAIFSDSHSFVGGNPEGSVTLVEFIDYRCGYCRKAHPETARLIEGDGDIRRVIKEFPILGEESVIASRFAIATLQVAGPEAYAKLHDGLYTTFRGDMTVERLSAFAADLGLDPAPIAARMEAPEVTAVIAENHRLAQILGISGTPTFILGDQMIRGYVPLEAMKEIVSGARG